MPTDLQELQEKYIFEFWILWATLIKGVCWVFLRYFFDISPTYLRHISFISQSYYRLISGISKAYLMHMSAIFQPYKHVYCKKIPTAALRHISGSYKVIYDIQVYVRYISALAQASKYSFSHEKISLSFDISLLFMDTEIFAAYAGSCLFLCEIVLICRLSQV